METATDGLSALSIATRLVGMAQAAEDIRRRSIEAGKDTTALRAIEVERATLATITERLGILASASLDELEMMQAVGASMAQISRTDPETGERIAAHFDELDRPDIAADLRGLFQENRKAIA